jgi:hypothetical protein
VTEIPEIIIPEIPQINVNTYISTPLPVLNVPLPNIDLPGCVKTHRDASVKNTQIIEDDVNGAFYSCPEGKIPSFVPINYDRKRIEIVEQKQESPPSTPNIPETKQPEIPDIPKEKETIKLEPCPGNKDQRVGDFRNEKRLERVIGHKRGDDGIECITLYEDVPFVDQYLPTPSLVINTAVIGLVAASSPLILNIIKPAIKNIVKKLTTKKKDKVE